MKTSLLNSPLGRSPLLHFLRFQRISASNRTESSSRRCSSHERPSGAAADNSAVSIWRLAGPLSSRWSKRARSDAASLALRPGLRRRAPWSECPGDLGSQMLAPDPRRQASCPAKSAQRSCIDLTDCSEMYWASAPTSDTRESHSKVWNSRLGCRRRHIIRETRTPQQGAQCEASLCQGKFGRVFVVF